LNQKETYIKSTYIFLSKCFNPPSKLEGENGKCLEKLWESYATSKVVVFSYKLLWFHLPRRRNLTIKGGLPRRRNINRVSLLCIYKAFVLSLEGEGVR